MGELVQLMRPDGKPFHAYVAEAAEAKAPSVVLIQEWWGLNEQMKGLAERLAKEGFRAIVPDLYHGKLAKDADEANHLMSGLNFVDAAEQDIQAAVDFVKNQSDRVGVAGFCMGGALTLISATRVRPIDAAVCFYGIPPIDLLDVSAIQAPLLGHFAKRDDWCSPDAVKQLEQRLQAANVGYEFHEYEADHAFMNEKRPEVFDQAAADLAWRRTVDFFRLKLA